MTPRERMVREIEDVYGFTDQKVFDAMLRVDRSCFTPKAYLHIAYDDTTIPLGYEQTMSQPYTVAFMTHLLSLKSSDKVLEIGTGSGYQAAVLARLASEVYTVEIKRQLARLAKNRLKEIGYTDVFVRQGSGVSGWPEKSPFDAILITAGVSTKIPRVLFDQFSLCHLLLVLLMLCLVVFLFVVC